LHSPRLPGGDDHLNPVGKHLGNQVLAGVIDTIRVTKIQLKGRAAVAIRRQRLSSSSTHSPSNAPSILKVTESPADFVMIILASIQAQYKNARGEGRSAGSHQFVIYITASSKAIHSES